MLYFHWAFLVGLGILCLLFSGSRIALAADATIQGVLNQVVARSGRTGATIPGKQGVRLVGGDSVRTGPRSSALLRYDNGSTLRLGELSEITIRPGSNQDVGLQSGSLMAEFRGPGRVVGRYAVAAVRGTRLVVTADPHSDTISDYMDGDGSHEIDVARADSQLVSGLITGGAGPQVISDTLVGSTENWTGAAFRVGSAGNLEEHQVAAFDSVTGTITLDADLSAAGRAQGTFILVKPATMMLRTLFPGFQTRVFSTPGTPPTIPQPTPVLEFARGMQNPSFDSVIPGQDIQNHLEGPVHEEFRRQNFEIDEQVQASSPITDLAPGIQTGEGAPAGFPPAIHRPQPGTGGVGVTFPGPPGVGGITVVVGGSSPRALRATRPVTRAQPRFQLNQPAFDALSYGSESSSGSAQAHGEESGVLDHLFLRAGVRGGQLAGRNQAVFDEAIVQYRQSGVGDLQAGRFHWYPGPTSVSTLGRLISFYTADGALYRAPLPAPVSLEAAYFAHINPLQGPATSGYAARIGGMTHSVHVGVTTLFGSVSPGQVGVSGDVAFPILPRRVEVYGEVGRDLLQENLYSAGVYLPILFHRYRSDVYLEYSHRQNFGSEIDLNAHFPIVSHFSGLINLCKLGAREWQPGIGVVAHF